MAILFADGFDTYHRLADVAARWSSNVPFDHNSTTYSDLVEGRRSGGKALFMSLSSNPSGTGASLYTTITPSTECALAFAIKPDYFAAGTGSAANAYHPLVTFASGSTMFLRIVRHAQTGVIAAYLGGTDTNFHDVGTYAGATALTNSLNGLPTGTAALTQSAWNHVQVVYKVADSGGSISVRLNGVEVWAFSGDTKPGAGTTFDTVAFYSGSPANAGAAADCAGSGVYAAHDDVVIATGITPIGDAGVVALQANGDGNATEWTATGTALGPSKFTAANGTITLGSTLVGNTAVLHDGQCSRAGIRLPTRNNAGDGTNLWVRIDFGTATDIAGWRWTQSNGGGLMNSLNAPTTKLQGSTNNSTWVDLDSASVSTGAVYDSGIRTIATANYRYFRWKVDCTSASGASDGADLTEIELFPPLASTAFNHFAETPNLTSTYLQGDALDEIQLAAFSDLGTTIGTVVGVQQRLIAGADSGSGTLIPQVRLSGTNYSGTGITVSGAGSDKTIVWDTNPATAAAWTRGQINGAEFGAKVG